MSRKNAKRLLFICILVCLLIDLCTLYELGFKSPFCALGLLALGAIAIDDCV